VHSLARMSVEEGALYNAHTGKQILLKVKLSPSMPWRHMEE